MEVLNSISLVAVGSVELLSFDVDLLFLFHWLPNLLHYARNISLLHKTRHFEWVGISLYCGHSKVKMDSLLIFLGVHNARNLMSQELFKCSLIVVVNLVLS
jgi:hypothetical protein